uniref:Uncharacterized protein n=1 Tax=Cyanoderma ruficeps TaxID=181631 RepID=A0A8C3QGJ4_9PASS
MTTSQCLSRKHWPGLAVAEPPLLFHLRGLLRKGYRLLQLPLASSRFCRYTGGAELTRSRFRALLCPPTAPALQDILTPEPVAVLVKGADPKRFLAKLYGQA